MSTDRPFIRPIVCAASATSPRSPIATLNHPSICTRHDIGSDYLVMEYVEGVALSGPLPAEDARRLGMQITHPPHESPCGLIANAER